MTIDTLPFSAALRALLPPARSDESAYVPAFRRIAALVLGRARWWIVGVPHRFTEIEVYFDGFAHRDPFTHGDAQQREFGRWYFHRAKGAYRGGTFKGLDIAFGCADAAAGILIRGSARLDGAGGLIDGPCLCVDHALRLAGRASIAELVEGFDRGVDPPVAGDSPLAITLDTAPQPATVVYETPRVGLVLGRDANDARVRSIARPYRFLTEPARIAKGRPHLVIGLHRQGLTDQAIARVTGATRARVNHYLAHYAAGKTLDPRSFPGRLTSGETCRLLGACERFLQPVTAG